MRSEPIGSRPDGCRISRDHVCLSHSIGLQVKSSLDIGGDMLLRGDAEFLSQGGRHVNVRRNAKKDELSGSSRYGARGHPVTFILECYPSSRHLDFFWVLNLFTGRSAISLSEYLVCRKGCPGDNL